MAKGIATSMISSGPRVEDDVHLVQTAVQRLLVFTQGHPPRISASTPHRRLGKDISGDLILSPVRVNASVRRTWVPGAQTAAQVPDHVAGSNVPARDTGGHYADARRSRVARGGRPSCGVDLGYGIRSRILSHLRRHAARRGCPVG